MKKVAYKSKLKKPSYFEGGYLFDGSGGFSETGSTMASLGANTLGTVGDIMGAQSGGTSVTGGVLSGAGKGASMGKAAGPWGAAAGAIIGGTWGGINASQLAEEERRAKEQALDASEQRAISNSGIILNNYRNKGTGVESFVDGGIMHYPYQEQDEGNMIAPTIQLAEGGELNPISDTTVEVNGDNPGTTDGVELENAFVDDGETIEGDKVYTDKFGLNGKKATKKNPSFADLHKKLQKSKSEESRYEAFNSFIDKKSADLFETQESLKEGDSPYANLCRGGKIKREEGGPIPLPIKKGETKELTQDLKDQLLGNVFEEGVSGFDKSVKEFEIFEKVQKANPQFKGGPEATVANPQMTYKANLDAPNSWYQNNVFNEKVQGKDLLDVFGKSASKLGLDPIAYTAAMAQEGWKGSAINEGLNLTNNIDSYGFGLDTVGDYEDVIEKKLGKGFLDNVELYSNENERKQAITSGKFKDIQQMSDVSAAIFQHRGKVVDDTAEELGIKLQPHVKQYFDYMGYNTQHNADNAVLRGKEDYKGSYNKTLKNMMLDYRDKYNILDKSKEEFDKFVKTKRKGGTNPYGNPDKGRGQVFKNAGDAYSRIADLKGIYSEDVPFNIKAPEEQELPSYLPKEGRAEGGYTDMNLLSAEHMKANLTKRKGKKKGYAIGGTDPNKSQRYSQGIPRGSENDILFDIEAKKISIPMDNTFVNTVLPIDKTPMEALQNKAKITPIYQNVFNQYDANNNVIGTLGLSLKKKKGYAPGGPMLNYQNLTDISNKAAYSKIMSQDAEIFKQEEELNRGFDRNPNFVKPPEKQGFNAQGLADSIGMYGSDIAGMFTRLPEVPTSSKLSRTTLEREDNKEELSRINRSYRGAARGLEQSSQAGAADATKASLFSKKLQGENLSYDRNAKINSQIANREAAINAQQDATDVGIENQEKMTNLSKELKEQEIRINPLTNIANKYMATRSEDKMRELDLSKMQLTKEMFKGKGIDERTLKLIESQYPDLYKTLTGKKYGGLIRRKRRLTA